MEPLFKEICQRIDKKLLENILEGDKAAEQNDLNKGLSIYENCLKAIDNVSQNILFLVLCLIKIGQILLQQKQFRLAALCNNSALALWDKYQQTEVSAQKNLTLFASLPKIDNKYRFDIQKQLANTITVYLHSNGIQDTNTEEIINWIAGKRAELLEIRQALNETIKTSKNGAGIAANLTQQFKSLFARIIDLCVSLLGKPPCGWIATGFGSMARDEMCPYSDIDFGFIIEDTGDATTNNNNKEYFRRLAKLIELFVINMGETEFPILSGKFKQSFEKFTGKLRSFRHVVVKNESPTPSGFSIDPAGLNPQGRSGLFELICTPTDLVKLNQNKLLMEEHEHLALSLKTTCTITGNMPDLLGSYEILLNQYLNKNENDGVANRKKISLDLLKPMLEKFKPPLDEQKSEERFFQIKKDLYRLINMTLECLAIDLALPQKSTRARIIALFQKNIIGEKAKNNLLAALDKIMMLRNITQLFYCDEIEHAHHPLLGAQNTLTTDEKMKIYHFTHQNIRDVYSIYRTLIPLHTIIKFYYLNNGDLSKFKNTDCFESKLEDKAHANELFREYDSALINFQHLLAIRPDDIDAIQQQGIFYYNSNNYNKAIAVFEYGIQTAQEIKAPIEKILRLQIYLVCSCIDNAEFSKGENILNEIFASSQLLQPEFTRIYVDALRVKAMLFLAHDDLNNSLKAYLTALKIADENSSLLTQKNICVQLGGSNDAHIEVHKFTSAFPSLTHRYQPIHGDICFKIGAVYIKQKNYPQAIEYLLRSLNEYDYKDRMMSDVFSIVMQVCSKLIEAYELNGDLENAQQYFILLCNANITMFHHHTENHLFRYLIKHVQFLLRNSYKTNEAIRELAYLAKFAKENVFTQPLQHHYTLLHFMPSEPKDTSIRDAMLQQKMNGYINDFMVFIIFYANYLLENLNVNEETIKILDQALNILDILIFNNKFNHNKNVVTAYLNMMEVSRHKISCLAIEHSALLKDILSVVSNHLLPSFKLNIFNSVERAMILNCYTEILMAENKIDEMKVKCEEALSLLANDKAVVRHYNPDIIRSLLSDLNLKAHPNSYKPTCQMM